MGNRQASRGMSQEDVDALIASWPDDWQTNPATRLELALPDPLAFALIYLPHHVTDPDTGSVTFSEVHLEWITDAKRWVLPGASRDCYVAPRAMGKSTWWFLILPLWAAAFLHIKSMTAIADNARMASKHLQNLKGELDNNELLRFDFPDLCNPQRRPSGRTVSDSEDQYVARSGFTFSTRGADGQFQGLKDGNLRPQLIIMDDIEPEESNYSAYLADKRLTTITEAILPLNENARVVLSGTVTMPGSIIHQLTKSRTSAPEQWITELKPPMAVHHHLPIVTDEDGNERSVWPAKWSLEHLQSIRHTKNYMKNYANSPMGADGKLWTPQDFQYGTVEGITRKILSIDPATTLKRKSDLTGLAVVGVSPTAKKYVVEECIGKRIIGEPLRQLVLKILEDDPEISTVLVEINQGGQMWEQALHDLPVKLKTVHQTIKKEVRAERIHNAYERGLVVHAKKLDQLEEQMCVFPEAQHDDLVDAVTTGIQWLMNQAKKSHQRQPRFQSFRYQ